MSPYSGKRCVMRFLLIGMIAIACTTPLFAQQVDALGTPQETDALGTPQEMAYFYIRKRADYDGAEWVYDDRTHKLVGYAPWDPIQRRWTLFSLDGKYKGFIQATVGDDGFDYFRQQGDPRSNFQFGVPNEAPPHFRQYLWYDSHNKYRGLFVKRLGGRPPTVREPEGELGGQLEIYRRGDIQSVSPLYTIQVHPLKKLPPGMEVDIIDPTVNPIQ